MFCRDNPGCVFLSTQSTARSDSYTGHQVNPGHGFLSTQSEVTQPQATSGTQLYHCTAAEIASTSGFVTAVSQHLGDNAYEIIGPDDESPQGANDISVAEVSPIPP
ncbi:uncharacterized protein LOC119465272 isoform X2 [Dermacentor silvarum]|uniref:uncharacterized protein LOC119465272 isoform X2 n=1 Tax=Dermacentor silvarum TaxID=543639 RepID=UPI002100D1CA|nr:uncharacterized protein LOC119465272 isoform X2 [Dermacentor silvarum]